MTEDFNLAYERADQNRADWEKELRRMRESHPMLIEALKDTAALLDVAYPLPSNGPIINAIERARAALKAAGVEP